MSSFQAGIFRGANERQGAASSAELVEEAGSSARREDTVEMSSENSGFVRSRSEDEYLLEGGEEDEDEDEGNGDRSNKKKKRKKYHRHTAEQIREMEA